MSDLEGLQRFDAAQARRLQYRTGRGSLNRESRDLIGDLGDLDVEAYARVQKPVDLPLGGAQAKLALAQPEQGAVVDQMAGIVAPHAVLDPVDLELRDIPGHQPVEVGRGIRPRDPVLDHRRQVVECRAVPDREVFLLDGGEHVHSRVSRPGDEAVDLAQGPGAGMKRRLEQRALEVRRQIGSGQRLHAGSARASPEARTCRAALRPAIPMTPPPGWQPAPHRYSPGNGVACCAAPGTGRTMKN